MVEFFERLVVRSWSEDRLTLKNSSGKMKSANAKVQHGYDW